MEGKRKEKGPGERCVSTPLIRKGSAEKKNGRKRDEKKKKTKNIMNCGGKKRKLENCKSKTRGQVLGVGGGGG